MSEGKMNGDHAMYLKQGIRIDPLVYRWVAWPYLVAPATHAMNLAFRHLPKLKSFAANPTVHIAASKDPTMVGGSFVALPASDVARVKDLSASLAKQCNNMLEFAKAYKELDEKVQSAAKGFCMDEFYTSIPEVLAGRLELVYDLNNHAKIKVNEDLLYGTEIDSVAGHEICLNTTADSDRTFFMSAPMLDHPSRLILKLNFRDERVDSLASMRTRPALVTDLLRQLPLTDTHKSQLPSFFTTEPPNRNSPGYSGDDVRVRYFGHACVLIQTSQVSILIDPVTAWQRNSQEATLIFDDLPDVIDYVVITHSHQDHFIPEMLLQLRHKVRKIIVPHNDRGNLADPSMKLILKQLGYKDILVLDPFESVEFDEGMILSLPFTGEHAGLDINSKQCVAVKIKGRTFLFLVDSDGIDPALYRYIAKAVGKVDVLFIGMECHGAPLTWLYGPLLTHAVTKRDDDSRRLSGSNSERAWAATAQLQCSRAFIYAMGQEPWLKCLMGLSYAEDSVQLVESNKYIQQCRAAGIEAERLMGCREMMF